MTITIYLILIFLALPSVVSAHCPLCTAGAGVLAVGASYLGISTAVVGVFIGAFSLALGLWISRVVKKKYVKYQDQILTMVVFLSTVIPIIPFIREYRPLYVSMMGEYGSLFHNTYTINLYLLGVVAGAVALFISPYISRKITEKRGNFIPFQGLAITLILLLSASIILQIAI